jgi:hypothetical protein
VDTSLEEEQTERGGTKIMTNAAPPSLARHFMRQLISGKIDEEFTKILISLHPAVRHAIYNAAITELSTFHLRGSSVALGQSYQIVFREVNAALEAAAIAFGWKCVPHAHGVAVRQDVDIEATSKGFFALEDSFTETEANLELLELRIFLCRRIMKSCPRRS